MFQPEDGQGAGRSSHEECRDILIVTRKRQARIASRLETHRADEHRIPA